MFRGTAKRTERNHHPEKTDRAPSNFSFEVTGNIDTLTELKLQDAWLMDAEGVKRDVEQTIRHEGGKTYVDLTADVSELVYPIAIDPTVTIQPDGTTGKDTYTSNKDGATNYGSSTVMQAGNFIAGDSVRNIFIEFDLSVVPSNANNIDASLGLYQKSYWTQGTNDYQINRLIESWEETTIV